MQISEEKLSSLLKKFLEIIGDFQNQATAANDLLRTHLQLENPMNWRSAGITQKGACGIHDAILYFFHGIGCRVQSGNILVDWDYGFDLWRLRSFVSDWSNKYP